MRYVFLLWLLFKRMSYAKVQDKVKGGWVMLLNEFFIIVLSIILGDMFCVMIFKDSLLKRLMEKINITIINEEEEEKWKM